MSRELQVTFDARDPRALSCFWREPDPPMSSGFIVLTDPEGNEFCLD